MPVPPLARALPSLVAVLVLAGCARNLDMNAVRLAVSSGLAAQVGLDIDAMACPEARPIKAGDVFECIAMPRDGGRVTITVTQGDDRGNVGWKVAKTEGLLDVTKIERSVQQGLRAQAHVEATVSCGKRWKAATRGDSFECLARSASGQKTPIVVTATDDDGNVKWATK